MPLQYSPVVRNAMLDQVDDHRRPVCEVDVFSGTPPASCADAATGVKLVEFVLASDWAAAASAGALASGDVGHFRLYASDGVTCHVQGTVAATGGGGDLTVDNANVANGQNINVTGFTINAPGA